MEHKHIHDEKIIDYVLGHLSTKEHFQVQAHISSCRQCAQEHSYWKKQLQMTSNGQPSPQLKSRLMDQVISIQKPPIFKRSAVIFSLCATLFICFVILSKTSSSFHRAEHDEQLSDLILVNQSTMTQHVETDLFHVLLSSSEQFEKPALLHQTDHELSANNIFETMSYETVSSQPFISNKERLCSLDINKNEIICVYFQYDPKLNQWIPVHIEKIPQALQWR